MSSESGRYRRKYTALLISVLIIAAVISGAVILHRRSQDDVSYELVIRRPLISVPVIQEQGGQIEIIVRIQGETTDDDWEAALHGDEVIHDLIVTSSDKICDVHQEWLITCTIPQGTDGSLYDLRLSYGDAHSESIQSVAVVDEINHEFTFVHAADTHIGSTEGEGAVTYTRDFIDEMNRKRPDFIILTGDISDKMPPTWAEQDPPPEEQDMVFYELIQELEVPVYVVHGNHDYSYAEPDDPEQNIRSYQRWINPHLNYSFNYGDYHFVMQNSGKYAGFLDGDGMMTMDNVTWMEEELYNNMDKRMRFVAMHHPVYPDMIHDDTVRDAFREAVMDHDVAMVLAGHTHSSAVYDAQGSRVTGDMDTAQRPLHVTTGDVGQGSGEYRWIRIDGDEVEMTVHEI